MTLIIRTHSTEQVNLPAGRARLSLTGSPDYLWQFGLIAIGSAYLMPLESGDQLSAAELNALGRNVSKIHTDMMFSSAEVSIMALARDGR